MGSEFDISSVTPVASFLAFEQAASTRDELRVHVYATGFVTRIGQFVRVISLDLLTSALLRTVLALSSSQEIQPDLGLLVVSVIVLVGHGSPDKKTTRACAALLRTLCKHLPSTFRGGRSTIHRNPTRGHHIVLSSFPSPLW